MLAGCSSTLLSPRHRLRSEASAMSTQRLDLPCGLTRKDGSRSQPVRPIGISVDKPMESKTGTCSLKQNIKLPPTPTENKDGFWEKSKNIKKRYAGEVSYDEDSYMNRSKKKRATKKEEEEGGGHFWFHPTPQVPFSLTCSGEEEERVCFMPSNISPPPLPPLSNIPWFEITDNGGGSSAVKCPDREPSSGSASSTSHGSRDLFIGPSCSNVEPEVILSTNPIEPSGQNHNGGSNNNDNRAEECAELINLLVACAEQITSKNTGATNHCLSRLGEIASPHGSPLHRLAAYFTEALALRAAKLWPHIFHITTPRELATDDDSNTAFRVLNQVTPVPKFIHFTSNEILLKAFEGKDRVHIIDFDVKKGLQWPSLFQSLASRTNPPSHVRITAVGESKQELIETGDRLSGFAERFGLQFEFHPVVDRLEDVRLWMLHVKGEREREAVAVNCVFQLHKLLYDTTGRVMRDFLGLIRSTNPRVIVVAEQEAGNDEAALDARLCSSLRYYSAVFDSVGFSGLPNESMGRMKVEEMFGREIRNIIACEGRERVERHRVFRRWREVMEGGGFRCAGIGERELLQAEMMLKMYSNSNTSESYRVGNGEGNGCLTLSWLDQPLYTVSAWTMMED